MNAPHDERPRLDREAEDFVRRIADAWAPAEMSGAERARFDARLAERLERSRARRVAWWTVAGAAGAAGVLLALWSPPSGPPARTAEATGDAEVILALARGTESVDEADARLPDDYQAIAALLDER